MLLFLFNYAFLNYQNIYIIFLCQYITVRNIVFQRGQFDTALGILPTVYNHGITYSQQCFAKIENC